MRRCLAGDRDAASDLVDRYQKPLFNIALRMLGNVQDAEDATQNVFLNVFRKLGSYDPEYRFFSWLYRMTVNESINLARRRKRNVTLEDMPVADVAGEQADAEERITMGLMQLKPDDRALVVMKHFVHFSYEEIADVLDIPVQTVKSRLFTARQRLGMVIHA